MGDPVGAGCRGATYIPRVHFIGLRDPWLHAQNSFYSPESARGNVSEFKTPPNPPSMRRQAQRNYDTYQKQHYSMCGDAQFIFHFGKRGFDGLQSMHGMLKEAARHTSE